MKKLLPLLFIGAIGSAKAQVIIEQADFATDGDLITYGNMSSGVDTLGLNLNGTGSGLTFDFSSLQTDDLTEVGFYDPAVVQGGTDFPTADVAVEQLEDVFAFSTVGAGSVEIIGLGGDFGALVGAPISVALTLAADNPWKLFEFPASVNSSVLLDTSVFQGKFSAAQLPAGIEQVWIPAPDSVWVKRVIYYEAEVVADGILTDPLGGTHNVIQMRVEENNIDTLWGRNASTGQWEDPPLLVQLAAGLPSNETVYRTRFISKELGYYVVDITNNQNGVPQSASFVSNQSECCTSVEEVIARGENVLYPNPTNDFIRVRTGGDIYQFNVMDMSGKMLQSTRVTIDGETVELNGLSNGLYIYQMLDEAGKVAHTGRLSVIK